MRIETYRLRAISNKRGLARCATPLRFSRACNATRIVEFGTSVGIPAVYFAAALRDKGGGSRIGAELGAAMVARARINLDAAGLADLVDIRERDARGRTGEVELLLIVKFAVDEVIAA